MPYDPYPQQTPGQQVLGGLQAFSESVNKLAMQHSLTQAQQQLDSIAASAKNEFEMHQQYRQVGQQLAFQLAAAGADASKIQSVVGAIPKEAPPPQNALEALASENPRMQEVGKSYLSETEGAKAAMKQAEIAGRAEVARINEEAKIKAASAKDAQKEDAEFRALPDSFPKHKDIAPLLEAQSAARQAKNLLSLGDQTYAASELVKIGILKSAGLNRITNAEINSITGNPDPSSYISRTLSKMTKGTASAGDLANFNKVLDAMSSASQASLESKIDDLALAKAKAGAGRHTYDDYRRVMRLRAGFDKPDSSASAPAASGTPAPAAAPAFGIPGFQLK